LTVALAVAVALAFARTLAACARTLAAFVGDLAAFLDAQAAFVGFLAAVVLATVVFAFAGALTVVRARAAARPFAAVGAERLTA
jgi:hypothetical protein